MGEKLLQVYSHFSTYPGKGEMARRGGMAMGGTWLYNTGTANTRFAITDNRGYLVSLSAHHSSGHFSSPTCRADNFVTLARLEFQTCLEIR